MRVCPRCGEQYSNDTFYCLNDGEKLYVPEQSVPPTQVFSANTVPSPIISPVVPSPKKQGSKVWLWILIILIVLFLFCGGGFIGLLVLGSLFATDENSSSNTGDRRSDTDISNYKQVLKDDLSKWQVMKIKGGESYYSDNLLVLKADPKYYYVLITPFSDYRTDNASVKIKLKILSDYGSDSLGYGLIVHSDPKIPLKQDYAFLIDIPTQMFRVVKHIDKKEETVVNWKYFKHIKPKDQENILEVVDNNGRMSFYINGKLATEYEDRSGIKGGVVGLYSSSVPVGFYDLELKR